MYKETRTEGVPLSLYLFNKIQVYITYLNPGYQNLYSRNFITYFQECFKCTFMKL